MDTDITDPSFKYAPSQNPIDPLNSSGSVALPNTMAQQVDFVPSGDDFADNIRKQTLQRVADQTNAMNLAISKAAAGNPDEAAAAQRLGYETGVGADIASRNMKTLQERAAVDRIGQLDLMRADPILAKMLSDQNFAAIALDDVDNLQSTGTMLDSVMGVKNEFLLGRERGYATTALGKTGGKMLQDSWLGKPLLDADRAEARRQVAEMEKMRGSGGFAESFGALEGQMESGLPGQIEMAGVGAVAGGAILGLPSGGLGLVPGMVAGAELGFLSASAVQSFEVESGASFVDLLDQDIPEDTARTAATIVGTINAGLEMIPLKFFTSRAKKLIKSAVQEQVVSSLVQVPTIKNAVGKFIKEWATGIGVESVTEVVQEITNITAEEFAKYETDPDFQAKMTTPEGKMEVANRLLSTFEEVAKGMAVMGFLLPGATFAFDARRARKANKTKQFFKDIGKDAATSKVRERNPNSYQAWFAERAKGTGAETIFVDVDKVRGAMVRNGINQEQLQFLLPDLYKQLQAIGANSGVDVTIPTSVYAARLVDTAFGQDLQSDMRLNPDDMSINDNNEYVKSRDTRVAELVKLSEEMTASDEILAESAKVVENRVVSEIMAVGKYTELEAKAMAAAHVAFAVVNAQSLNMTPDQFDIQYGMATRGEGQAVPAAPLEQAAVPAPSTGVFDANNPPISTEPIFAVMNADGQIYYDVNATMHGDLVETFPDIADTTIDGGFIINGKYKMGMSDGGYSAFEGTSEQVEQVKEFTKQANAVSQVLEQAAKAKPGADSPGIGVGNEPKLGFWKPFRVKVVGDVEIPKKKLILTGTKNKNADKQLVNIDGILAKFPTAGESIEEWTKMMAYALGSDEVPIPPYAFIKGINGDGSFNTLSKLTEGQISDANHGFENAAELRAAYTSGELSVTTTAKLILWSFLSRGVSPYRQESLFIDAFNKSAEWIGMAAEGKFSEKDFPAYDKWARSAAPKGSGLPGAGATHNLNAFGKDFLFKMSKIGDNGKSHLQNLHDMLSDPNQTGQSIRREFAKIGEGVGIDNKVMSFTLLVAGFDDVMVLDRVQIRQLWDDGRFPGVNLYDGTMNEKGKKISGSSMNDITEGVRGILVYEALERQLQLKIYDLYARLGRPQDASVGRYHWETWVAFSEQEASHGTLAAVLADAKGDDQAIANVASKEGEYGAYEYGAMYNRNAEGMPGFQYQTPSGNSYSFTVSAFREFLANIKLPKNGVVPTQFKVTESANAPWYTRPEVNQQRLDEQAAKWADLAGGTGEGKRITDEIIREQNANRARSATDAIAIAEQWEVPALPDGSSSLERKFYAGSSATKFARLNRQQGIFDTHFSYERQTVADTEGLYRLGVPIVGEYVAGVGLAELYKRSGNATPTFYELGNTVAASERFHAAIVENKQASPFGAAVAVYTPKEYRGMRLFLSADAKSGVAVKPDGDIVSVFAANNSGRALIELAVSAGGTKLDAYDTVLAHFYAPHGFVVASRIAWDEKQILEDWDKKTFSAFNNGEPDVVFMARDDAYMGSYKSTDGKLVTKYEDAVEIQSEAINVINEQLFQAMPSPGRRGSFDPTRLLTTLNTKADLSTFLHESSHFFFSVYTDIASRPGAPARIAADVQILLDSFGVKDIAAWNAMTFEEQRKYQEQFAYNFEIYLFEGKAPSIEMQGLFERFSKWLRRVYTSISTELNDIYRREFGEDLPILTDEIRGVMGRMLASEAQIKRAEAVNEMKPQFQTQAESGMDDARWAAYQAMIEEAHDQAVTDLTKASLRQMEWLSNARSRLLKNMQSKHDEIRKEMRTEIEAEVMAEPLYMAMSILKTGQGRAKNGELVQFNDKFKLNLEAVKKMLPSEEIAKLGYGKYGMVSEDGIPPDMVAEIVGFVSGDELVLALLTAKPAKEEIAARLDKRMMDEYGKMNTPEAREAAVQAAIHNEARERFVAVEARFIAKATQPVRVMIDAAKAAARQIVGAKKIDDISPGEYAAAEARASRDAAEAYKDRQTPDAASKSTYTRVYNEQIAKGVDEATAVAEATSKAADASTKAQGKADAYKAKYGDRTPEQVIIRAKQAQVLQNQLVKEATSSLDEVDTAVKDFRKFFGSDEKIAKSRNMDLVDAARAILSYYGFGKVGKNPADYIRKLEAYNPELYAEIEPLISQASTGVQDYTQMTMDDFRMLRDVVDALWAQSRRDKQITVAGKKIALDGVLSELDARLNEIGVPTTVPGEKSALTTKQKFAAHLYSAKALLRRVENWADATDGAGGVGAFTKYIYRPVKDAVNAYRVDRNNYVKRFVDLVSTLDLPVGKITSPEIDYTFGVGNGGIGKAELLGAMLHTGNESNYKKLLVGRGWGSLNSDGTLETARWDSFVQRMIAESVLTKNDFDFLQSVWDLNEEIKPIAQKAHRDLYGYYFKEVEATQFTNTFGTYRGGYVPAKTDAAIVRDAQRQAKAEELDADFRSSMPSTGMGFTKSRVEYNKPLSLDVRLMAKHIDDVLRFANIQPAIKDALRIVNNRGFADKLSRIDPTVVEFMLLPWLNRTARQSTNEPGRNKAVDKFWRVLRSRTGMAIMFANLRNALQQVTGLFPSALKVSKGALKDSLLTYLASPRKTAEAIAGLSPFMNERMHSQIFEIQDQMNDLLLNPNKFDKIQKWSQHHGYFLQSAFQNFVDIVTWNGKYNQVLSEIGTTLSDSEAQAEAIQQADAAVRSTQGSMSAEDVAAFEVGSPFYKTFVQFTGYFNMLANLNTDEYVKVLRDLGWRGNKGKLVSIYMLGFLAPTLVADAIARSLGAGWDNDDDGYLDDVADWFFGSQVRAGAAMVPFGSAAYTALSAGFTDKTYDDRITSSPSVGSLEASTVGVGKAIVNLASDDKELEGRNVRDVLTLITNATGVPVSVLGRPIGYQMEVERGKIEPTGAIDYMRGLITGVPSAESKKK
jgi:hypothetical protein